MGDTWHVMGDTWFKRFDGTILNGRWFRRTPICLRHFWMPVPSILKPLRPRVTRRHCWRRMVFGCPGSQEENWSKDLRNQQRRTQTEKEPLWDREASLFGTVRREKHWMCTTIPPPRLVSLGGVRKCNWTLRLGLRSIRRGHRTMEGQQGLPVPMRNWSNHT